MTLDAGQLYLDHAPAVRRMLGTLLAPDEVDDVLADVFERVVRSVATYEDRGYSVRAWLYAIARSKAIDLLRYERCRPHMPLERWHGQTQGPEQVAVQRDHARWLRTQVFTQLHGKQFTVIWLRFIEEKTLEETAAALGTTVGAVKAFQWRALARLRAVIDPDDYAPAVRPAVCAVAGCGRAIAYRDLCHPHYRQWIRRR